VSQRQQTVELSVVDGMATATGAVPCPFRSLPDGIRDIALELGHDQRRTDAERGLMVTLGTTAARSCKGIVVRHMSGLQRSGPSGVCDHDLSENVADPAPVRATRHH
jgi:hypothetical protein